MWTDVTAVNKDKQHNSFPKSVDENWSKYGHQHILNTKGTSCTKSQRCQPRRQIPCVRCISSTGMLTQQYMCSQTKTNDSCWFVWETSSIAFSSCLCSRNVNQCFCHHRLWNRKFRTKAVSLFAYLHVSVCVCIYANVCMCVCTYSQAAGVRAGPVALVVCRGPRGGERRGVRRARGCHGRLVRRRWRIKVSVGFIYGGLASNISAAEGHSCTLFEIQHEEAKQALI